MSTFNLSGQKTALQQALRWSAVALELKQLARDAAVKIIPSVMLANAVAAFALNLVQSPSLPVSWLTCIDCKVDVLAQASALHRRHWN